MGKNTLVMDSRIYEDLLPSFFLCDTNLDVFRIRVCFCLFFVFVFLNFHFQHLFWNNMLDC